MGVRIMMGKQVDQGALFYEVRLEDRVPAGHLLRRIDAILDLGFVREVMAPHYARGGRPSVDPELLLRMLLVGYLYGVRSERRLCEEVDLNLAYRWFCRLGLDGRVPDHSTFAKNRHGRFRESGLMRELFERIVEQCLATGLAGTEHVVVDGSHIKADANKQRCVKTAEELPRAGEGATRAVREYLADLETAAPDPVGVTRWTPKAVSTTDPATAFSGKYGRYVFSYGINVMVDSASGIILDACASAARTAEEPIAAYRMIDRVRARHGVQPRILAADTGYGSGHFLDWLERQGIEAHIPLANSRDGTGKRPPKAAFIYDAASDTYACPHGKTMHRAGIRMGSFKGGSRSGLISYYPSRRECGACPIQPDCAPSGLRTVQRSIYEPARERAKAREGTDAFVASTRLRRRVERVFACIKHHDDLHRVRLRGLRGADEQFLLATTARNLKRMVRLGAAQPSEKAPAAA
jgi:transposase